jgi:hypothetical protein
MTTTTTPSLESCDRSVKSILSDNTKLRKLPNGSRIINAGVTMAPAKRSGLTNVCPHATAACILVCVLWFAGRTVTRTVRAAAIARTKLWHFFPDRFYARLDRALAALARRAARLGVRAFCRLNVASDIDHPHAIAEKHSGITFYDYTASVERAAAYGRGECPANYHMTYSVKESTTFADALMLHNLGVNLTVVFDSHYFGPLHRYGALPATVIFRDRTTGEEFSCETNDADIHDLRAPEFDGRGRCNVLRAKGSKSLRETAARMGFIRHHEQGARWYVDEYRREGVAIVELR